MLQGLLGSGRSNREREVIKYSVYKAAGITPTTARRELGLENMHNRAEKVENVIKQISSIERSFNYIMTSAMCASASSDDETDDMSELSMSISRRSK